MTTANQAKAAWARRKAADLRAQASTVRQERVISSNWRGVQTKMRTLSNLSAEAAKFDRIASSLSGCEDSGAFYGAAEEDLS